MPQSLREIHKELKQARNRLTAHCDLMSKDPALVKLDKNTRTEVIVGYHPYHHEYSIRLGEELAKIIPPLREVVVNARIQ